MVSCGRADRSDDAVNRFSKVCGDYYYYCYCFFFFSVALRPNAGHGLLILEVFRSHTTTHHIR
jgi:hypothetical protein